MAFSHHSHSGQFCLHAQNTLEEMVQTAISRKFRIFALTEHMPRDRHCDLYPEEIEANQTPADLYKIFAEYYNEAIRLKHKYASEITILVGFECDYIRPASIGVIEDILRQYHWDMFVGSVHHVHTIPIDFDRPLYEKARKAAGGTDELLFQAYFDEQFDMLRALKPPVVGHFDLIRLKSDNPDCSFQQWDGVWERILRNLAFIQSYGGLVELNSASLRKGLSEPYPNAEICKAFLEKNGRFTLSDDSHSVDQVMLNYDRVLQFVRQIGISTLHFLERGNTSSDSRFPNVSISAMSDQPQPLPETIQIPVRQSSLAAIEAQRLKIREGQHDLKRKLSDSTLERGSEKHIRLQIEETILEREELKLGKAEIDLGISKNGISKKSYRDASRTTSDRIISLGDELWQLRRKLKAHNESMGKAAILTPDSEGAFVSALLHLYKDPNVSKKRSSTAQSEMRKKTIAVYNALATEKDIHRGNAGPGWLQCLISGEFRPKQEIKAAHIVPTSLGPELVDYIFGNGTGSRLFSADNCMMLYYDLEKAFDSGNFVIVPMDPMEKPIRRWKTVLVNQGSRNRKIGLQSLGSLGLLDEREIKFPTGHRPASRFFYYHFLVSLLRCRYYRQPGWQEAWQKLDTCQPWPMPGRYLRESMLLCLARATDSEISDDTIKKLFQDHTFSTADRLSDDEEEEIVRRMQEIHEGKIKEQEEQEEMGIGVDGESEDEEEEAMKEIKN